MSRTVPALRRALALDPNLEDAAQQIVSLDTDAGKLAQAYQEAKAMVENRPQSGFAHFTLSYVLRYAGLTKEAARGVRRARCGSIRATISSARARAVFFMTGQFDRARDFLKLDAGSEWSNNVEVLISAAPGEDERGSGATAQNAGKLILPRAGATGLLRNAPASGIPSKSWSSSKRRSSPIATRSQNSPRQGTTTRVWEIGSRRV